MKLILVRHGHTYFNQIGLTQGWCDSPLSSKGKKQVEKLERVLRNRQIDYIYCSTLGRAYETASLLNQNRHLHIQIDERLKEIHFGYFEGLPEHLRDQFDVESKQWTQDFHMNYESYGGEDILKVIQRHDDFFNDLLLKHHSHDTIFIVGHGCSLYAWIKNIFQEKLLEMYPDFHFFSNAEAVILQVDKNQFQIEEIININKEDQNNEHKN